jgi:hypothetical protein
MPKVDLKKYSIYTTKHGSHAYGLSTPESDLDIKGVFVAPINYYNGFLNSVEQIEEKVPNDLVIYELRKFFRLAADCNPNIIEVLHTDETDILEITSLGRNLREIRHLFISQKAKFTFAGYAHSQLQRIRAHYRWLKNPPNAPPTRAYYGLPENTLISSTDLGIAEATIRKQLDRWDIDWEQFDEATKIGIQDGISKLIGTLSIYAGFDKHKDDFMYRAAAREVGFSDNLIEKLEAEKKYSAARHEWDQYQTWIKTRNPKRAELEAKFGYDTKHAMHLVRLMRMGKEILETGKVVVRRPDREELLDIRHNGIWSYDQLVAYAEEKEKEIDAIYASGTSPIPKSPNREQLDGYCIGFTRASHEQYHPYL